MEEVSAEDPAADPGQSSLNGKALRSRRMMAVILCLGLGSAMALGIYARRYVVRRGREIWSDDATSKMRSLGLSLQEFESEYGEWPSASTAETVKAATNTPLTLGANSSNQLFRQLLVTSVRSEWIFYARTGFTHKPDGLYADDAHALAPGECGFAYIPRDESRMETDVPILMTPTVKGGPLFDASVYGRTAYILRSDDTVVALPIDKSGHAIWKGMDLLDPRQTFWHGKAPDVKWPE